jgi:hypothetical protein
MVSLYPVACVCVIIISCTILFAVIKAGNIPYFVIRLCSQVLANTLVDHINTAGVLFAKNLCTDNRNIVSSSHCNEELHTVSRQKRNQLLLRFRSSIMLSLRANIPAKIAYIWQISLQISNRSDISARSLTSI